MKKLYPLFILLALFLSSCKDLNDKRLDAAKERIAKYSTQENITVLSTDFKSLAIPFHEHAVIEEVSKNAKQLEAYKKNLHDYKQKNFAGKNRVWIKDMTEQQIISYKNLMDEYDKTRYYFENKLRNYYYYDNYYNPEKEKGNNFWIKYKEENSDSIKYGVFYFDRIEKTVVTRHIIFDEQIYNETKKLIDIAKKKERAGYLVPTLDSIDLDIVPEDEDPSKTKEERVAIKIKEREEREARERAHMMRTNPIQRTFYGATLGTNSANKIINRLINRGCDVIEYFPGNYFSKILDHMDVIFWSEIRIISASGKITKIELTNELTLGSDPKTKEILFEKFYNNIVKKYREKYSFWEVSYNGTHYKDEKTTLKIENDGHSRVWATYTLNE